MKETPEPITREDMYYDYLINGTGTLPKPITRKEQYLYRLCISGLGNGGTVSLEAIQEAVADYMNENYEKFTPKFSVNLETGRLQYKF